MKIDLHIHSRNGSDGRWSLEEIFAEANIRQIEFMSITDHDSIDYQDEAKALADKYGIKYISGVELNVTLSHSRYTKGEEISLDFLGYGFDTHDQPLMHKLKTMRDYRQKRAEKILENINREFAKQGRSKFTNMDLDEIRSGVDGSFGRPHIANHLIKKGVVSNKQEAFEKYLIKCDVPKMYLSLEEASTLIRDAGGKLILAHPNDPNGTSMVAFTTSIPEQLSIISEIMKPYIDGLECWHTKHTKATRKAYLAFARKHGFMVTGGSDCHQQPLIMGSVNVPDDVAKQFGVCN